MFTATYCHSLVDIECNVTIIPGLYHPMNMSLWRVFGEISKFGIIKIVFTCKQQGIMVRTYGFKIYLAALRTFLIFLGITPHLGHIFKGIMVEMGEGCI